MNEELLAAVTARVWEKLAQARTTTEESVAEGVAPAGIRALLLGSEPPEDLGYRYVKETPYEAVVLGSLTIGELLYFRQERVLEALLEGKPVYLYLPGVPKGAGRNRHLEAELVSALNRLRAWGVVILDGGLKRRLVTAQEARRLKAGGLPLPQGCILTPSARDILM